jgi:site-specific recombinase XerD
VTQSLKIDGYESAKRWLSKVLTRRTKSDRTAKIYLWHLAKYCEWCGKNPDELIREHLSNRASQSEEVRRGHEELVTRYFVFLETQRKVSRNTALLAHAAIRSFYRANYAPLELETPESWPTRQDRILAREEVAKLVEAAPSLLAKALIAFSAQSGQRVGVVTSLTYGMIRDALQAKGPGHVHVPANLRDQKGRLVNKSRQVYDFFIGEDAKKLLREYLDTRGVLNDDELVFVSERKFGPKHAALDDEAVNRIIRGAAVRSRAFSLSEVRKIHHHVLRKFFQTTMEEAGISPLWYEYMMGHSIPATQRAYSRPSLHQLEQAYIKAEPFLELRQEKRHREMDELEKMRVLVWRENLRLVGVDPEKVAENLRKSLGRDPDATEEVEAYIKEAEKKAKEGRSVVAEDRRSQSKVVSEDEVVSYLEEGWEPVLQLKNGNVVIRKQV